MANSGKPSEECQDLHDRQQDVVAVFLKARHLVLTNRQESSRQEPQDMLSYMKVLHEKDYYRIPDSRVEPRFLTTGEQMALSALLKVVSKGGDPIGEPYDDTLDCD